MRRIDSGFQESFLLKAHHEPLLIAGSNTAPARRRKHHKSSVEVAQPPVPRTMDSQRPESEMPSRPSHHRSRPSSSETSTTHSRGRGHGSRYSSHRTSCTIVDPSRSRHYRIQSSNTVPTATSQDIDDVYALHHRSYSLFQNPSIHTKSGLPSPSWSQSEQCTFSDTTGRLGAEEPTFGEEHSLSKPGEDTTVAERPATTMHWTSPCTRRREYERIDKANSGVRGLLNRVMPRCVSGPQEKFYEKDQSDAGSVRRYRIDNEDEVAEEKELARPQKPAFKTLPLAKKKWICF